MNREQSIHFITQLFADVWTDLNEGKLAEYYHHDVQFSFGKQVADYDDIVHRLRYVKQHYKTLHNTLEDILVDGDKIIIRLQQECGDTLYDIIIIYQVKDDKIYRAWSCLSPGIDYFEE